MIDFESEIFTSIASVLREQFPGIYVTGEYVHKPPKLPAVMIEEMSNAVHTRAIDNGQIENAADVMYQVDVYSNRNKGRKEEVRAIIRAIDEQFSAMRFERSFLNPVPNMNDATIYRMTARYRKIMTNTI